jgi:hypothetical protein
MSVANDALLYNLGIDAFPVTDDQVAGSASVGTSIIGAVFRVISSVASGVVQLKSSVSNEAQPLVFVINDSANTIVLKPFTGESLGGVTNGTLNIPAGQSAIAIRVPVQIVKGGGGGGTLDWRAAVIP